MQSLLDHVRENVALYATGALVVLPFLYYFRKRTGPLLYHLAEYCIYLTCMHILLGGLVRIASWYKSETSMVAIDANPFTTPLWDQFWVKELYRPESMFYVELGFAFLLAYVVVVIRPVRLKNRAYNNRPNEKKKPKKSSYGDRAIAYRNRHQQTRR